MKKQELRLTRSSREKLFSSPIDSKEENSLSKNSSLAGSESLIWATPDVLVGKILSM